MMSPIFNSSNFMFATVMVVSSTAVILAFLRQNKPDISPSPPPPPPHLSDGTTPRQSDVQNVRPCLYSGPNVGGKKERKKKKVQFAENVNMKKMKGCTHDDERIIMNNELLLLMNKKRSEQSSELLKKKVQCISNSSSSSSPNQIPQNRIALYNAILRQRSSYNRIQFSY